jgi:hypothetical protein
MAAMYVSLEVPGMLLVNVPSDVPLKLSSIVGEIVLGVTTNPATLTVDVTVSLAPLPSLIVIVGLKVPPLAYVCIPSTAEAKVPAVLVTIMPGELLPSPHSIIAVSVSMSVPLVESVNFANIDPPDISMPAVALSVSPVSVNELKCNSLQQNAALFDVK